MTEAKLRSVDYYVARRRFHRCSLCHHQVSLERPDIILTEAEMSRREQLLPVMIGNELMGFSCTACMRKLGEHIITTFRDGQGFPLVNDRGELLTEPAAAPAADADRDRDRGDTSTSA